MSSASTESHHRAAAGRVATCAVLTVSDTRTPEDDASGRAIRDALTAAGHHVADYTIVQDDAPKIKERLTHWLAPSHTPRLDAILTTGGTGIAPRDTTVEVVRLLLSKELEGFGELFRMLSYAEVGPAAMLSRAVAGLAGTSGGEASGDEASGGTLIFTMPGSVNAVTLAMEKLIVPELGHLVWERGR